MSRAFKVCSVCGKMRSTMSSGAIKIHNRWDAGKKAMVYCEGSLRYPKKDVFRS